MYFNYPFNASIGRIITAFRAGKNPANVPAAIKVKVAWMAMCKSTVGFTKTVADAIPMSITCSPATLFMYSVQAIPAIIPIYPNKVVIVMLSAMINVRIE